jgi:hypothetical protein
MIEPKFAIGQEVYVAPTVNRIVKIVDRVYDPDSIREGESGYRYRVEGSPAWFPESWLETKEELDERLREDAEDDDEESYEYDGDSGCAFIRGEWRVVDSRAWERWNLL